MAFLKLKSAVTHLKSNFSEVRRLIDAASDWHSLGHTLPRAGFSKHHFELVVQLAFLQAYLAWEQFLEEAFILYLLGKKSPSGFSPKRYASPPTREHALKMAAAEARHTDWTAIDMIVKRANRCFGSGRPFVKSLRLRTNLLNDLKTLRNAAAHASTEARGNFESLVRREIGHLPANWQVGSFLAATKLNPTAPIGSVPPVPITFLEHYLKEIAAIAEEIVPS
jgi:hypothetical protein